jgi:DNA-binding NtrC family response regulator
MIPSSVWPQAAACDAARTCILVVEDELLIRFMLSDGLRDCGYHVIEACSADEALIVLETAVPDLIISDVRMPGSLDGMGLLALVRKTLPTLPVIITSAHLQSTLAIADGATQFIAKPYTMDLVLNAVSAELDKSQ